MGMAPRFLSNRVWLDCHAVYPRVWISVPEKDEALYRRIRAIADIDPTADFEAVVGYGSFARFREEAPVDLMPSRVAPEQDRAFLFRWDFVVPEDNDLSDDELLKRAIKLSRNDEIRDSRRQFHDWRRKLIAKRATMETARSEMDRCLAIYADVVSKAKIRTRVLRALQVVAATAPLADLTLPGLGMAGGVVFGIGALLAERFVSVPTVGAREKLRTDDHLDSLTCNGISELMSGNLEASIMRTPNRRPDPRPPRQSWGLNFFYPKRPRGRLNGRPS